MSRLSNIGSRTASVRSKHRQNHYSPSHLRSYSLVVPNNSLCTPTKSAPSSPAHNSIKTFNGSADLGLLAPPQEDSSNISAPTSPAAQNKNAGKINIKHRSPSLKCETIKLPLLNSRPRSNSAAIPRERHLSFENSVKDTNIKLSDPSCDFNTNGNDLNVNENKLFDLSYDINIDANNLNNNDSDNSTNLNDKLKFSLPEKVSKAVQTSIKFNKERYPDFESVFTPFNKYRKKNSFRYTQIDSSSSSTSLQNLFGAAPFRPNILKSLLLSGDSTEKKSLVSTPTGGTTKVVSPLRSPSLDSWTVSSPLSTPESDTSFCSSIASSAWGTPDLQHLVIINKVIS